MAPKKKQTTAPKKTSAKASTTTKSKPRVAKKQAPKPTAPTRRQPARKAARSARLEEAPADDAEVAGEIGPDTGEGPERAARPPKTVAPQRRTQKRKAPDDDGTSGDDSETDDPKTRRPASKKAKADKGKGKVIDTPRGSKRPRTPASGSDNGEDQENIGSGPRRSRRGKEADSPGSTGADDRPADGADAAARAAEEEREDPWEDIDPPLATTEARVDCMFQEEPAELIVAVKVFGDPNDFRSRLGYLVRLRLARTDGDEQLDDVIGYILAWRVSKPTPSLPNVNPHWHEEILSEGEKHETMEETSWCLQALLNPDGTPRPALKANTGQVVDNPLMFIQMIYIRSLFQRKGLLAPALNCFYTAIGQLPQWFAFAGSLVLVPSAPSDYKGGVWKGIGDAIVETSLIGVYRKQGYAIWIKNARIGENLITVMGRALP